MLGPIAIHTHGPLVGATIAFSKGGASYLTAILKATFAMIHEGAASLVPPQAIADEDTRLPGLGTLEHASDLSPFIPGVDVVLRGHARAPGGELTPAVAARLVLYRRKILLDKTLHVYGDRVNSGAYPRDFAALPLLYELARGGPTTENPLGAEAPVVPNIVVPNGSQGTAGFAPLPRDWPTRRRLVEKLPAAPDGLLELDDEFPFAFFHSAPEDQRVDAVEGDEWILLDGMHAELPRFATKLPGAVVQAQLIHDNEVPVLFDLCCDTVAIDADDRTVSLVWRGHLPLPHDRAGYAISARIDIVDGEDEALDPIAGKTPRAPAVEAPALFEGDTGSVDEDTPDASSHESEDDAPKTVPPHRVSPRTDPPPAEGSFRDMPFAKAPAAPTFGRAPSEPAPPAVATSAPSKGLPFRPSAAAPPAASVSPVVGVPQERPIEKPPLPALVSPPLTEAPRARQIDEPTTASWQDDPTPDEAQSEPTAFGGGPRTLPFKVSPEVSRLREASVPTTSEPKAPDAVAQKSTTSAPVTVEASVATTPDVPRDRSLPKPLEPKTAGATEALSAASKLVPPPRVTPPVVVSRMPTQLGGISVSSSSLPPERSAGEEKLERAPATRVDAASAKERVSKSPILDEPTAMASGDTSIETPVRDAVSHVGVAAEPTVSDEPHAIVEARTKIEPPKVESPKIESRKAVEPEAKGEPEETGIRGAVVAKLKRREAFYDANYAGLDLSGIDFSEAALSGINLAGAKLSGCSFKNARMSGAKLIGADLHDAVLAGADLAQADLSRALLERARFDGATITDANFTLAVGRTASFDGVNGVRATFAQGQWQDASFRGATLTSTDFSGAEITRTIFERAQLASARFSDARGADAKFEKGELDQATFTGATLKGASFDDASLQGSSWERATLDGASFHAANMARAVVARATIGRASFVDADLEGANFIGATGDGADFRGAKLSSADLRQTKLGDAGFEGADLNKVNAHKAVFASPRFTDANLTSASFRAAKMKGATLAGADLAETDLRDADLEGAKLKGAKNRSSAKLGGANLRGVEDDEAPT